MSAPNMNTSEDMMRNGFEAFELTRTYAKYNSTPLKRMPNGKYYGYAQGRWEAWQTAWLSATNIPMSMVNL